MEEKENMVVDLYRKITCDYETGCYDQKQLSENYNVSLKFVAECTQYYGFHHTKAKEGKNPIIEKDEIIKLIAILEEDAEK